MYEQSAMSRQFVASPGRFGLGPNFSAKRSYIQLYGLAAVIALPVVLLGVMSASHAHAAQTLGRMVSHLMGFALVLGLVGWFAYYFLHNNQRFVISLTGDALTIDKRAGDLYAFSEARLGRWAYGDQVTGTALHLHSASRRFVLGGRDHRVGEGTRLDEPPVIGVDAWLPADQFDELLAVVGPGGGLDVRSTAPGGPVRCLLFPNAMRAQQMGPFAMKKRREFLLSITHAQLAIDVDADEIRVTDYGSNTLITSAGPGQITAKPATYQYQGGGLYGVSSLGGVLERAETQYLSVTPEMVVQLPRMQELTIACRDAAGNSSFKRRFSWRGQVQQRIDDPADYSVSAADWLVLVEKFGLTSYLEIHD
jgi:hypothetical protein